MNQSNDIDTESEIINEHLDCSCNDQELIMDKVASISYIAMMSVVAYSLVSISVLVTF